MMNLEFSRRPFSRSACKSGSMRIFINKKAESVSETYNLKIDSVRMDGGINTNFIGSLKCLRRAVCAKVQSGIRVELNFTELKKKYLSVRLCGNKE